MKSAVCVGVEFIFTKLVYEYQMKVQWVIEVCATKKFLKDKMTGRVDTLLRIFDKIAEKNLNWSHRTQKSTMFERF